MFMVFPGFSDINSIIKLIALSISSLSTVFQVDFDRLMAMSISLRF